MVVEMLLNEYRGTRRTLTRTLLAPFLALALLPAAVALLRVLLVESAALTPRAIGLVALSLLAACVTPLAISGALRLAALPANRRFRRQVDRQLALTGSDLVAEFAHRRVIDRNRGPVPYTCITDNWLITVGIAGVHRDCVEGINFTAKRRRFRRRLVQTRITCTTNLPGDETIVFKVAHPRDSNEVQAVVEWYTAGYRRG